MTTINPSVVWFNKDLASGQAITDPTIVVVTWSNVLNTSTCAPVNLAHWADRSVEVNGTFGSGGTVNIEVSNGGVNYYPAHDMTVTNAIAITSSSLVQILEVSAYLQPVIAGGDGTTALNIILCCRRPQDLFLGGTPRP